MPRRNSPNAILDLHDLSRLGDFVVDKRQGQRAAAKKNRRNRHYEKQFIRNTLTHRPAADDAAELVGDEPSAAATRAVAEALPAVLQQQAGATP